MGSAVRPRERKAVLPPDLFAGYAGDAFWDDLANIPPAVRII